MKRLLLIKLFIFFALTGFAQDIIPKAKTKAEKKAERKSKTIKERVEGTVPLELPSTPSLDLPGETKISNLEDAKKFVNESIPGFSESAKKERKRKKKVKEIQEEIFNGKAYYGVAVKKVQHRRGSGKRMQVKEFYVLNESKRPNPYHRNLFWWDSKKEQVIEAISRNKETNTLMHGPFKLYVGENLMEEGFYYLGAKDGRWVTYDKNFVLLDKKTYNKGFLDGSTITYYDGDSTLVKEVMPNNYGKVSGDYFMYYPDGTLAEEGVLDDKVKVGKWVEYYQGGNRRKKEVQYGTDCYDETEPYIIREYDEKGKLTFENEKAKRI